MRYLFCILCFAIFGCGSKQKNQYPESLNNLLAEKPFTVVISYSNECPVCILYTSVLKDIFDSVPSSKFQLVLLKVNADEVWDFMDSTGLFSINKPKVFNENSLEIAEALNMKIFPEAVVLNNNGEILYQGAIDSRVKEIGNTHFRPSNNEQFLKNALVQLQNNQSIEVKQFPAKGCFIEFPKKP